MTCEVGGRTSSSSCDGEGAARARAVGDGCHLVRRFQCRVLGAVDEAGEVAPVVIHEARNLLGHGGHRGQQRNDCARHVEQHVVAGAVAPHPHVVLRGRGPGEDREVGHIGRRVLWGERAPGGGPEAEHDVDTTGGGGGLPQRLQCCQQRGGGRPGAQIEFEVAMRSRALREDAWLRGCHGDPS